MSYTPHAIDGFGGTRCIPRPSQRDPLSQLRVACRQVVTLIRRERPEPILLRRIDKWKQRTARVDEAQDLEQKSWEKQLLGPGPR